MDKQSKIYRLLVDIFIEVSNSGQYFFDSKFEDKLYDLSELLSNKEEENK